MDFKSFFKRLFFATLAYAAEVCLCVLFTSLLA